eukprot:jgi/Chlat1/4686/Chrsp3S05647
MPPPPRRRALRIARITLACPAFIGCGDHTLRRLPPHVRWWRRRGLFCCNNASWLRLKLNLLKLCPGARVGAGVLPASLPACCVLLRLNPRTVGMDVVPMLTLKGCLCEKQAASTVAPAVAMAWVELQLGT